MIKVSTIIALVATMIITGCATTEPQPKPELRVMSPGEMSETSTPGSRQIQIVPSIREEIITNQVTIRIDKKGKLFIDGQSVDRNNLPSIVKGMEKVHIKASVELEYSVIAGIFMQIQKAGVTKMTFSAEK